MAWRVKSPTLPVMGRLYVPAGRACRRRGRTLLFPRDGGGNPARARPKEHAAIEALFAALIVVPIDTEIGRGAGGSLRQSHRSHSVELGDALIASTASIHKLSLWTRNRKHYPMPGLAFY